MMQRNFNSADRAALARLLRALFDQWQLTLSQQLAVMGLCGVYAHGNDADLMEIDWPHYLTGERLARAGQLLTIHASLRTLFPANPELAYRWMQSPNRAFDDATPLSVIEGSGMNGLLTIGTYLKTALGQ